VLLDRTPGNDAEPETLNVPYVSPAMAALFDADREQEQPDVPESDPSEGNPKYFVRQHECPDCGGHARIKASRVVVDHLDDCTFRPRAEFFSG
jgi:hypothetical protein